MPFHHHCLMTALVFLTGLSCQSGPAARTAVRDAAEESPLKLDVQSIQPLQREGIPDGVLQLDYRSPVDGRADWAWLRPPADGGATWVVSIHGHGSHGDQLYTRPDIGSLWLGEFARHNLGILTPNLRDNAWMSPAAAEDLRALLEFVRSRHGAERFVFVGGSMGGTSSLIYAILHPEDVAGVVALCPATDLSSYVAWCRQQATPITLQIAEAIEQAYGGGPSDCAAAYARHSTLGHADRLTMPVHVVHGAADTIIPASQSRRLAGRMNGVPAFGYRELPAGGHDAPLAQVRKALDRVLARADAAEH